MSDIVVIEKRLLRSENYRTLTATAKDILMDFMMKRRIRTRRISKNSKCTEILNNGEIEYCFSEAEKKGITRSAFNRNRDLLIERGFIDIAHKGSGGKKGDKNLYAISDRWKQWGTENFIHHERQKDKRRGIGFQMLHAKKNIGNTSATPISNTGITPKKKLKVIK